MMPSQDCNSHGKDHCKSFNNIPISNSQNVHLGDNHVYNDPHGLDTSRLAEVLRGRPQFINRKPVPELNQTKRSSSEAQDMQIDYGLPFHIKREFPFLERLKPEFKARNEGAGSIARHLVNKLRIKSISNPLDILISDCLKERLDKVKADLDAARSLSQGSHRGQWQRVITTAVEMAIAKNSTAMLDLLLCGGANINGWGYKAYTLQETPLLFAIGTDNLAMVNELIRRGANLQKRSGPVDCPLKAAVLLGFAGITKALVSAGAEVLDTTGKFGNSLLAATTLGGANECLKTLLEQLNNQELDGGTVADAVMVALECCNRRGADLLLEKARLLQASKDVSLNLSGLLECAAYFNSKEAALLALDSQACVSVLERQKSLEMAAAAGNFDVLEVIVQHSIAIPDFLHLDQQAALSLAVRKRDRVFASYFSTKGRYIYAHDHRSSALKFAVGQGNLHFVKLLTTQGALKSGHGEDMIELAAETCHVEIVMYLINEGAQLAPAGIKAALEYAATCARFDIVRTLAQNGAIIQFPEHDKALELSVYRGDIEMTKFLVQNGINNRPAGGSNILEIASRQGFLELVQFLVRNRFEISGDALVNAVMSGNDEVVKFILQEKPLVMSQRGKSKLLAMAVKRKYGPTTVTIVEHGVRVVSHYSAALETAVHNADIDTVKYLVSLGALATDELVEVAAKGHQYNLTVFLLEQGANLQRKNHYLESAIRMQDRKWVKMLLEKEANSNYVSPYGPPMLNIAVSGGDRSIISQLFDFGAKADHGHPVEKSALALAVKIGSVDVIRLLVNEGANPNGIYSTNRTLLAKAVDMRKAEVVSVLLEHGADPNLANKDTTYMAKFESGEMYTPTFGLANRHMRQISPLSIAIHHGDEHIVRILLGRMRPLSGLNGANSLSLALKRGEAGIAQCLVNAGAELVLLPPMEQSRYLYDAVLNRKIRLFKFLREQGASFTTADGASALMKALRDNDEFMVKECLNAGADPNRRDMADTPLGIAASKGNYQLTRLLLERGADPNDGVWRSRSDCLHKALWAYSFGGFSKAGAERCGRETGKHVQVGGATAGSGAWESARVELWMD